MSIYQNSKLAK